MQKRSIHQSQLSRAIQDTKFRPVRELSVFAVSAVLAWLMLPETDAMSALKAIAIATISAVLLVPALEFVWHLLNAPVRQRNEAREAVKALENEQGKTLVGEVISCTISDPNMVLTEHVGMVVFVEIRNVGERATVARMFEVALSDGEADLHQKLTSLSDGGLSLETPGKPGEAQEYSADDMISIKAATAIQPGEITQGYLVSYVKKSDLKLIGFPNCLLKIRFEDVFGNSRSFGLENMEPSTSSSMPLMEKLRGEKKRIASHQGKRKAKS